MSLTIEHPDREVLVKVRDLKKHFPIQRGILRRVAAVVEAVDGISFDIYKGETVGLVGESGCGKSTAGRAILQLVQPTAGQVFFDGAELTALSRSQLREKRRQMQLLFPDPYAALNPRLPVSRIVSEPLEIHGLGSPASRVARAQELLRLVGLNPYFSKRYPHEFSGGQRLRIGLARALATNPSFLVADEPLAALDVSLQAQMIRLLVDLKESLGLTYLFITNDFSLACSVSDRLAVMHLGRIVEMGERDEVAKRPLHPYTQALRSAIPDRDKETPPAGCRFQPRCAYATDICRQEDPALRNLGTPPTSHLVACHHAEEIEDRV